MMPTGLVRRMARGVLTLRPAVGALLHWWRDEMMALTPAALRRALASRRRRLRVEFDGHVARLRVFDASGVRDIDELAIGLAATSEHTTERIRAAAGPRLAEIAVELPRELALQRTVTVPAAARRSLASVLTFEMDRYTPFKADQVYFAFEVGPRPRGATDVPVALTVVPRRDVDPLLGWLRRCGLEATSLGIAPSAGEPLPGASLNLLPAAGASRAVSGGWTRRLRLLGALMLVAVAIGIPFYQRLDTLSRLEHAIDAARTEASQLERASTRVASLVKEHNALIERRNAQPAVTRTLLELTRLLPDGTWLTHLEIGGPKVRLRGESGNASEVVALIEKSPLLKDASFDGSVTRDSRTERERFALSASTRSAERK